MASLSDPLPHSETRLPSPELPWDPVRGTEVKGVIRIPRQCLPSSTVTLGVQAPPPPDPMYLVLLHPQELSFPHPETSLEGQAYLQITHLEQPLMVAAPAHPGSRRVTNLLRSPGSVPWSRLLLSHSSHRKAVTYEAPFSNVIALAYPHPPGASAPSLFPHPPTSSFICCPERLSKSRGTQAAA